MVKVKKGKGWRPFSVHPEVSISFSLAVGPDYSIVTQLATSVEARWTECKCLPVITLEQV